MSIEELKKVIVSQREEIEEIIGKEKLIQRECETGEMGGFLKYPNILAILGIRRCGKSVFSLQIFKNKKFGYVNFDDERLSGITAGDLDKVLQSFYELYGADLEYLILDEPQNVAGWELFANRLRRTKKVVLTGSNAKILSGELATHLTGRHIDFTLYPFSFAEFLDWKGLKPDAYLTKSIAETKNALNEYVKLGGFPEAYLLGREAVSRLYEDIVYKDIISRHGIRNKKSFLELARYLISNFSNEFSFRKLQGVTSIKNVHTVKNYTGYMESAYLIFVIERFSFKLKGQMMAPKKVYCIDTGMINAVAFRFSQDAGRLMENLVAVELKRRESYFGSEGVYYWKDHQQREVDFVLTRGGLVQKLVQVSYASGENEIKERELRALFKASEVLRCNDMEIITWDYEGKIEGVKCVPLWKWLLT